MPDQEFPLVPMEPGAPGHPASLVPAAGLPSPSRFEAYARMAHAQPILSLEQEQCLVERWRKERDPDAARQLVLSHLRLVVKVVRSHRGYGLPEADLAQEGTVGLMRAVHRFDPRVGVRLAAYALRWVEAEVREFIFRNYRLVRLGGTAAMKKLFFGYRHTLAALRALRADRDPGVSSGEVARALGVDVEQVEAARGYFLGRDLALDAPSPAGEEDGQAEPSQALMLAALPAEATTPAEAAESSDTRRAIAVVVRQALDELPSRDRDILSARRLSQPPVGLVSLGKRWGISAERVRQIEARALARLRDRLEGAGARGLLE